MNADEIREELAKRGISVMRKVVATDIAALNKYGYEVLSYKKKYYYYYVVSRPLETAEVVMLADAVNASKLPATQKKHLWKGFRAFCVLIRQIVFQSTLFRLKKAERGAVLLYTTWTQ